MGFTPDEKTAIAFNVLLPVLAATAVGCRFLSRSYRTASIGADDWTILVCLVLAISVCICSVYRAANGLHGGPFHKDDLPTYYKVKKILWVDIMFCGLIFGLTKISILLFYRRIFVTKTFKKFANIMLVIMSGWTVATFFTIVFSAKSPSAHWTTPPGESTPGTVDMYLLATVICGSNMVLDFIVLLMPIPVIKSLYISRHKKVYLGIIFSLGIVCVLIAIVHLRYTSLSLSYSAEERLSPKQTHAADANDLWQHIEACVCIITACLPTFGPLVRDWPGFRCIFASTRSLIFSAPKFASGSEDSAAKTFYIETASVEASEGASVESLQSDCEKGEVRVVEVVAVTKSS